jgi:hypothetical protein
VDFSIGVIGEANAELVVDLSFEVRIGTAKHSDDVLEPCDEGAHLGGCEGSVRRLAAKLALESSALVVNLGDPLTDDGCVGARLEDLTVAGKLGLALFEPPPQVNLERLAVVRDLAGFRERLARGLDVLVVE